MKVRKRQRKSIAFVLGTDYFLRILLDVSHCVCVCVCVCVTKLLLYCEDLLKRLLH